MKRFSTLTLAAVTLWFCTSFSIAANTEPDSRLPAMNDPPVADKIPGKFIFADFFTSDIEAAKTFYGALFGWEWRWINSDHSYGMFYKDNLAVAGIAQRDAAIDGRAYGRWIYYISTDNLVDKVATIKDKGGRVLLEPQLIADRGTLAVVADNEDALFGLLDSSSGDSPDFRAAAGEWIWTSLYSRNSQSSAQFYQSLFNYEVSEAQDSGDELDYILSSQGYARAGVSQLSADSDSRPTWLGYVQVEDVEAEVARALELGAEILLDADPSVLNGGLVIIADPMGAPVALIHWTFEEEATP